MPREPGTASCEGQHLLRGPGPSPRGCRQPGQGRILRGPLPLPRRPGPSGMSGQGHLSRAEGLKHPGCWDIRTGVPGPPRPRAPRGLAPMRSAGPQAAWPVASGGVRSGVWLPAQGPARDPIPAPPARAAAGRLCPRPGRGRGHGGRSGRPAPGVCPGARAATLRTGRGRAGARGPGGAGGGAPARGPVRGSNRHRCGTGAEPWRRRGRRGRCCCCSCCCWARGPGSPSARAGAATGRRAGTGWPPWGAGQRPGAARAPASWGPCRLPGAPCPPRPLRVKSVWGSRFSLTPGEPCLWGGLAGAAHVMEAPPVRGRAS